MCLDRTYWEEWEKTNLAPYACKSTDKELSKRRYEPVEANYQDIPDPAGSESRYRTSFQIDRDRILNSTAFRRLEYKTQIFVNHEGDNYRTRLTHTTEVSSIAKRIAIAMRLNEDLVEAIALGHDLGHTPFGHAGEEAFNKGNLLGDNIGFHHNVQSLRIVDELEEGYDWDRRKKEDHGGKGLNLTFAVREGILKHTDRHLRKNARGIYNEDDALGGINKNTPPTIEAQVVALADEIAQRVNDIEDGLRSGLLSKDQVIRCIEDLPKTKEDLMWLIRAENPQRGDEVIVDRRTEKYFQIIENCKKVEKPPTMGNIIGFVRELWTANAIEYSRKNIKKIMEVSTDITNEYSIKLNLFDKGQQNEIENIEGIETVPKLRQEALKDEKGATAEFCEIVISKEKASLRITNRTLTRDKTSEKLIEKDKPPILERDSTKYFIKWINSDMAVWRTQRVLVLAETTDGQLIKKNYPIEQVKIRINEIVISFNSKMIEVDKEFKYLIEKNIHRSSKVSRMNTKAVELLTKVYKKFLHNPFQLPKNVLDKCIENQYYGKDIESLDTFINRLKENPKFKVILADHIAGMTDRYLINEFERLYLPSKDIEDKGEIDISRY